ncbi:M20/M25/M40 family metallo-hydrolase [Virgibacillus xinjiangensis]|uniref:M20/M25/M40 family metallo-hydrolase n=1 Tax=Virgibacillus xinjiangensis TaxID=393090 RepID=A0ABV7CZ63_9BACI
MGKLMWNTPEALKDLLYELVSWQSRSLTEGERTFPDKLEAKLSCLEYFKQHPEQLELQGTGDGRHAVTALYKHESAVDTVVLISHFDTVNTEEYGHLEELACEPAALTKALMDHRNELPEEALRDLDSGDYLFGRGTMDMKTGLALHMSLLEKASTEDWPVNLLLITVPDEEVDSVGMRAVVPQLVRLKEEYGLDYRLFLNSEPTFQRPGDENYYIYTGSIGKIMPAALLYGQETHVGNPLSGLTANYMATFLTQQMEWNPAFRETDLGEETPLPISLRQKDLMTMEYSTQTPYRAQILYNVFLMRRSASEVMDIFRQEAAEAAAECNRRYQAICKREKVEPVGEVQVLLYEELIAYAEKKLGKEQVMEFRQDALRHPEWDDRETSIRIVDKLMLHCQELGPAMVLLYATPYYPPVNSSGHQTVKKILEVMKGSAKENLDLDVHQVHYFNGISDLSYVNYKDEHGDWKSFEKNAPVWGDAYTIPFEDMLKLQAPVLNIGPFGKDAHKRTERLHRESAFVHLPHLLETVVRQMMTGNTAAEKQ